MECEIVSLRNSIIKCKVPTLKAGLPYQLSLHRRGGYGSALSEESANSTIVSQGVVSSISPSGGSVNGGVDVVITGFGFTSSREKVFVNTGN